MDVRDYRPDYPAAMDFGDTIMHVCVCGGEMWCIYATFDDYEISGYMTEMTCVTCGSRATAPCEVDRPGYEPIP